MKVETEDVEVLHVQGALDEAGRRPQAQIGASQDAFVGAAAEVVGIGLGPVSRRDEDTDRDGDVGEDAPQALVGVRASRADRLRVDVDGPVAAHDLGQAEHVGIKNFQKFLLQVREMLEDDGIFYLQIAGLRRSWQYEDLVWGLLLTIVLGLLFTSIQAYEYGHAAFAFSAANGGNVYGSIFFMATGFHGFHVIVGTIFLIVCLFRALAGHFTPQQHFGFEAAAWYWHFVDVVWLFLFVCIYVWGSRGAEAYVAFAHEFLARHRPPAPTSFRSRRSPLPWGPSRR